MAEPASGKRGGASSRGFRILPFNALTPRQQAEDALVCHSAFDRIFAGPGAYRGRPPASQYPSFAPYRGLAAVQDGSLVARLEVVRFRLRVPRGRLRAAGLAGVATRPDRTGRGLARRLIRTAHAREERAGVAACLLFTSRKLTAHRLYESIGYHDIRAFPRALRAVPAAVRRPTWPWRWRPAHPADRHALEGVHRDATAELYGFSPRPHGWWRAEPGWWVLERSERAVGYARVDASGSGGFACLEALARDSEALDRVWAGVEWTARGRFLALGTGLLGCLSAACLEERGYARTDAGFGVLMARLLPHTRSDADTRSTLGADGPQYSVFAGDGY